MFLRFLGLSFFVPRVVSTLPKTWALLAGYGDFVAGAVEKCQWLTCNPQHANPGNCLAVVCHACTNADLALP
jgi:hypothetical protein